ncbi:MAG: MBL fold metallo-hydrolase [Verrucomicrobiota bacterium]
MSDLLISESGAPALKLQFRGVRGSTPAPGRGTARYGGNTSCVEVTAGNQVLILDAGSGIRELGAELVEAAGSSPVEATILISHTHWDHIQGLPFFAPAFSARNHIRVIAPKGKGATLERALRNQLDPINFPVGFDQMLGLGRVEELASDHETLGAFTIGVTNLSHPGGCAGFRIEANGASIAYLPDHEPFESICVPMRSAISEARRKQLVEFVNGVDLLILDTQYTETEYRNKIGWGHGCLPDSVALAVEAGVQHLVFFHHDPAHDDDQLAAMLEQARRLAPRDLIITGAVENETITFNSIDLQAYSSLAGTMLKSAAA